MASLSENIKIIENKKRQLEESVDSLQEECVRLKAQGKKKREKSVESVVHCFVKITTFAAKFWIELHPSL